MHNKSIRNPEAVRHSCEMDKHTVKEGNIDL